MEKLGVELDDQKVKEAESGAKAGTCPKCGQALVSDGHACPTHGTEPFEKRPPEGDGSGSG